MDKLIRLANGALVALSQYQQENHLFSNQVAKHFSVSEMDCAGNIELAVPLLRLLDAFREKIGRPVKINSGYRTPAKQKQLRADGGFAAASISPHCYGMAADVDAISRAQVLEYARILRETASLLSIKVRLGYKQYLGLGQTFVHVDVCPEFYAKGKPLHNQPHPISWQNQIEW